MIILRGVEEHTACMYNHIYSYYFMNISLLIKKKELILIYFNDFLITDYENFPISQIFVLPNACAV